MKKWIANLLMLLCIAGIALGGILVVSHMKGNENGDQEPGPVLQRVKGNVSILRQGLPLRAETGMELQKGDRLETATGATVILSLGEGELHLNSGGILVIGESALSRCAVELCRGELFLQSRIPLMLTLGERKIRTEAGCFSLDARSGSSNLSVFEGTAYYGENRVSTGQTVTFLLQETSLRDCALSALSPFVLEQLSCQGETVELCFPQTEIQALLAQRQIAGKEEIGETATFRTELPVATEEEPIETETVSPTETEEATQASPSTQPTEATQRTEATESTEVAEMTETSQAVTGETGATEPPTEETTAPEETEPEELYCTVSIYCNTILDNLGDLEPGKLEFVPDSGVILYGVQEAFTEGETVFDVLQRVCNKYGIALEYSWTPMYNNYYIEGINHIYEFDCGGESGWMYKVNGWFPNYGCSEYVLQNGDNVVWCYTCKGLGTDVGGGVW